MEHGYEADVLEKSVSSQLLMMLFMEIKRNSYMYSIANEHPVNDIPRKKMFGSKICHYIDYLP